MDLAQNVKESNPVRVFLQAGQSGCVGQADPSLLQADNATYPDLVGPQDGVWLASFYGGQPGAGGEFSIRPMNAGESMGGKMGPEISIGRRIADASDNETPILIIKYCVGGTNLRTQWNPDTNENNWNKNEDDGSSEWLLQSNAADFNDEDKLYANFVYTIRKTKEILEEASIPYRFAAFFWIQGSADKGRTWYEYGMDTIRFFDSVRLEIGEPKLPIIDTGSMPNTHLKTGKEYAAANIKNGNVYESSFAWASDDPSSSCIINPYEPCLESTFINFEVFKYYGVDPVFKEPPYNENVPEDFKEFYWFKDFPLNQHKEYEGIILFGRMYANAYVREFADWATLSPEMEADDPSILFPWEKCAKGEIPSNSNFCWIDERTNEPYLSSASPFISTTCYLSRSFVIISYVLSIFYLL